MNIESNLYFYKALVKRVVDGDTIRADIDWGNKIWTHNENIRFSRINTYETRLRKGTTLQMKERGLEAKVYVKNLIENKEIIIKTFLKNVRGKYGRILAEIYFFNGKEWKNLNDELVNLKYAVYQKY